MMVQLGLAQILRHASFDMNDCAEIVGEGCKSGDFPNLDKVSETAIIDQLRTAKFIIDSVLYQVQL